MGGGWEDMMAGGEERGEEEVIAPGDMKESERTGGPDLAEWRPRPSPFFCPKEACAELGRRLGVDGGAIGSAMAGMAGILGVRSGAVG
jgi:hypothetical protein